MDVGKFKEETQKLEVGETVPGAPERLCERRSITFPSKWDAKEPLGSRIVTVSFPRDCPSFCCSLRHLGRQLHILDTHYLPGTCCH